MFISLSEALKLIAELVAKMCLISKIKSLALNNHIENFRTLQDFKKIIMRRNDDT